MITATDETTTLLIRARALIERGWCRGANARDAKGSAIESQSKDATAWCAAGALFAAGLVPDDECWHHPVVRHFQAAIGGNRNIQGFNDDQETVEPILAAFDRAIKRSRR